MLFGSKKPEKDAKIIVVGCGVFGLSTILELTKKGYTNVLGLDVSEMPSPRAAATDYNKMLRVEYANIMYAKLSVEALRLWENDPLYNRYYHKSGRLVLSPYKKENQCRAKFDKLGAENVRKLGCEQRIIELKSSEEVGKLIHEFDGNNMPDPLVARYNIDSAYGESGPSLVGVWEECARRGAEFLFGDAGNVTKVEEHRVTTVDGSVYEADKIIVSAGAYTPALVDLNNCVTAVGHFVSHVKLTDEQYERFKEMPIFFSAEYGYFFPPDAKDHLIKIGHTYGDCRYYTKNPFDKQQTTSIPYYINDAPIDILEGTRRLMQLVIPELADNPVVDCKIGWTSISSDAHFVIDWQPRSDSILICTGDSAHAYKFLPNIGKYIVERLEGTLPREYAKAWRYRHGNWVKREVSERTPRKLYDLQTVRKWVNGTKPFGSKL